MRRPQRALRISIALGLVTSCTEPQERSARSAHPGTQGPALAETASCDPEARAVVERLGERLRLVSTLAPDTVVARDLDTHYRELVTPRLLSRWKSAPAEAPGRSVSSPWPDRIEIDSAEASPGGGCRIDGKVVYATSAGPDSVELAGRESVTIELIRNGVWRIDDYRTLGSPRVDTPTIP